MDDYLYEVPPYEGQDDYLSDVALDIIATAVLGRLPMDGFDLASCQATTKGVTATVHINQSPDPLSNADQFEAILLASTVVRTLHANLVAARKVLVGRADARFDSIEQDRQDFERRMP